MCTVALAFAGVSAVGTAAADYSANKAQWRNQVANIQRQNIMAIQKGEHEGNLAVYKDQQKNRVYEAQLKAQANARTALHKQLQINQQEANRASVSAQLQLNEKFTEAAFQRQTKLVESIKAQGTVLASGMQPGQSMLLELQDVERQMGFEEAAINASLKSATQAYGMTEYGINLSKYSADSKAVNSEPAGPSFSPGAEFGPVSPIMLQKPSKPGLLGSIMKGVSAGVQVGSGIGGTNSHTWYGTAK